MPLRLSAIREARRQVVYTAAAMPSLPICRLRWLLPLVAGWVPAVSVGDPHTRADPAFEGVVRLEIADGPEAGGRLRLLETFALRDAEGRRWEAPAGALVSGVGVPPALRHLFDDRDAGTPLRKAAVLRDAVAALRTVGWKTVARVYHDASRAELASEPEAKALYAAWYAGGLRWEPRGSSCYSRCHASAPDLVWHADLRDVDLQPVLAWIWSDDPGLDAIDARLDALMQRPGPHLFAQPR